MRHPLRIALLLAGISLGTSCDEARLLGPVLINASGGVEITRDLKYGEAGGVELHYDLYKPSSPDPDLPLLIMVHGGSWTSGDRNQLLEFAYDLAAHGYACASIDYRLVDENSHFPAQVADVIAATDYFTANAASLGIDPDRIGLLGLSAGGYLALLAGLPDDLSIVSPELSPGSLPIKVIVDLFGPTDFTVDPSMATPTQIDIVETLLGTTIDQADDLLRVASPIYYVRQNGPTVLIVQGDADTLVPVSQSRALHAAMQDAGEQSIYYEVPGMDHLPGAIWELPFAQDYRMQIISFLGANL